MNFFSIRTNDQLAIGKVLSKNQKIVFTNLSWHQEEVLIGDIVFIVISGDNSKKEHAYNNGLRALGKVVELPQSDSDGKHFSLEIELFEHLHESLTKEDFYPFPQLKDAPNIGPDTKSAPNQAFRKIDNQIGKAIIRAMIDLSNGIISKQQYNNLVDSDFKIEKLISRNNEQKNHSQTRDYIQIEFIDWFYREENYKKSYEGLVTIKVLDSWDATFFGNRLFDVSIDEKEASYKAIENLITDKGNIEWKSYSESSSNGAPEAVLGKNNYLKFLAEFLNQKKTAFLNDAIAVPSLSFNPEDFKKKTIEAGLIFSDQLIYRFIASLYTKPFVICSGLSGSGKTKLAQSFVQWICQSQDQYKIVAVGADWTNREPLLGYPDGLNAEKYVSPDNGALQLIIDASKTENKNKPYFLILDEMNLSHVERYFADFLSIMESHDSIKLYSGDKRGEVSQEILWPKNLFIIGTVNIDETTYMFSPKVLDRANVIEFRISEEELKAYLTHHKDLEMDKLFNPQSKQGYGSAMAKDFLDKARANATDTIDAKETLISFFNELKQCGAEFGYRSASEINRLISVLHALTNDSKKWDGKDIEEHDFVDIAIMQKLLPKLHGSRNKLTKVLPVIGSLCLVKSEKIKEDYFAKIDSVSFDGDANIKYKLSFEKICRMYKNAIENGYASYAEA